MAPLKLGRLMSRPISYIHIICCRENIVHDNCANIHQTSQIVYSLPQVVATEQNTNHMSHFLVFQSTHFDVALQIWAATLSSSQALVVPRTHESAPSVQSSKQWLLLRFTSHQSVLPPTWSRRLTKAPVNQSTLNVPIVVAGSISQLDRRNPVVRKPSK